MPKEFETIIFDCDGTLVDSEPISTRVLVEYASEFGLEMTAEEALELFVGRDMPGILLELQRRTDTRLPAGFVEEFRSRQAVALREQLQPIPGAHELLERLSSAPRPFCVASNAPQDKIEINLTVTGLKVFFQPERVFSAYDINAWKPKPDLFLFAARQMKTPPNRCVVIEDSPAGIEAGLAAGMHVVGFDKDMTQEIHEKLAIYRDRVPFVNALSELQTILA